MKRFYLVLLVLCSASNFLIAQNVLSGFVMDNTNQPIYYANVALYQLSDSSFIKGTATDEQGNFSFQRIKNGQYYLEISMLGYASQYYDQLDFPTDNGKSVDIKLTEDATVLSTVEVTAKVPLLEQKADRLVVNVADNVTSLNGTLLDVMKKVPGILVVGDELRMAGQQNVTILLNGKTTRYMDVQSLLKDIPGDNIQRVEVIHQPGAEFDAEGTGPIINIVLKKNSLFGTNGSWNLGVAKGEDWKYRSTLSLSHYQGSLNVHGNITWKDYPYFEELRLDRRVGEDFYEQVSIDPYDNQSINMNLGADWDIHKKHRVGFSGRYFDWSSDNLITNLTNIDYADPSQEDISLQSENKVDETWKMRTINPYYRFEIDTAGHQIDLDVNFVYIENGGGNILTTAENTEGVFFPGQQYQQPGTSEILTAQLDYTYPVSNALKIQLGGKYSDANLDNNLIALVEDETGRWKDNPFQSNHFLFEERIKAAYTKISFNKEKWSGTAGLRFEESNSVGYSITLDSTQTRDISRFFPSASLTRAITKDLGATLAYAYRIDRPRYSNLNPFVFYLDPFTFERGNPTLAPAYTHSMKFSLTYEKQPFFNVEYKSTAEAMVEVTEQNDLTGETSLTTVNLESFDNLNISLFFPLDFLPGISGYGGFIANYSQFNAPYLDDIFNRSKWDYTGFMQAQFKLPGEIKSEITGWYNSGGLQGIINATWMYGVDVGFSRKFLADKLKVSVGIENLFNRFLYADITYANMNINVFSRWDGPVFNFQASYKFGNQHLKSKGNRKSSASDELNRIQQK